VRADVGPLHRAVEGGRATQGKEVRQRPCQKGGRRSDVGVVFSLVGASFLGALTSVALGPFLPMIARDLRTSVPLLGQTATAALFSAAVLGLIVGPLADRYGHRRLLLAGLWAVALCGSVTAAAHGYLTLLGGQLLGSISIATLEGVALAVAGARFVGRARRRAMSAITGAIAASSVVGIPLLAALGETFGWRAAFLTLGAAGLCGVWLVAVALPRGDVPQRRSPARRTLRSEYAPLLRHRPVLALVLSSALRAVFWMGAVLYLGALFSERHGFGTGEVGLVYLASGIGYLAGSAAAGSWLGDSAPRATYAATTICSGALFGLAFAAPLGAGVAVVCITLASFLAPFGWVTLAAMLSGETPAGQATTMVLAVSVYSLGAAIGGAAGGLLLAWGGYAALGVGLAAFAAAAVLSVGQSAAGERSVPPRSEAD
jgi:MFS transporter, DHA1 family, inner membrane transport protein